MRISDWSSDVCSSDLTRTLVGEQFLGQFLGPGDRHRRRRRQRRQQVMDLLDLHPHARMQPRLRQQFVVLGAQVDRVDHPAAFVEQAAGTGEEDRSEEHTSELQSLMRSSYAVFCLKKTKTKIQKANHPPLN